MPIVKNRKRGQVAKMLKRRIKGRDIVVFADGLSGPRKLRYLHSHPWFGALYSDACLPLGAFHIGE